MYLDYQTIGKRIRLLRKQQHLSQMTLAEMVDKSPTYISLVENGQKGPSLEMLIDVANALKVTMDVLLAEYLEHNTAVNAMNLKEAFRFQNKLGSLMEEAQSILGRDGNITRVENTYLRKKVFDGAENETVIDTPPTEYADRITDIVRFLTVLMEQREALSKAIHAAKNALPIDMDSEVGLNAKRQEIARVLKRMSDLRNSEVVINGGGIGYRFNQEGNQVTYRCDVNRVTTINFDRKVVRNLAAEMNRRADHISAELDRCLVNSEVAYEAPFDVNDSFAEVFDASVDPQGKN